MSELDKVIEEIHDRANAAAEVLFHLGAEAAFAIVLAALMDRERYDKWIEGRKDLTGSLDPRGVRFLTRPHNEVYIEYLKHVIEEETSE
jgi:hypothetical protein